MKIFLTFSFIGALLMGVIFSLVSFRSSGSLGIPIVATTDTIETLRQRVNQLIAASSSAPAAVSDVAADNFPYWTTSASSAHSPTSTLFRSGLNLYTGGTFNASGTITQNGVAITIGTLVESGWLGAATSTRLTTSTNAVMIGGFDVTSKVY